MVLGDGVVIHGGGFISTHQGTNPGHVPVMEIGSRSNIGRRNHIYALGRIEIGKAVLTASNVYISDCTHGFDDIHVPIMDQPIRRLAPVRIGDGTWIGANACIIGCTIGRNCVVAANSVVLDDVEDYCVVAGAPARVVRRVSGNIEGLEIVNAGS